MVVEWFLRAFVPVITAMLDLFATDNGWLNGDTLDSWATESDGLLAGIWEWNSWIPVDFMMGCLVALLALRLAVFTYRTIRHVWDALPLT